LACKQLVFVNDALSVSPSLLSSTMQAMNDTLIKSILYFLLAGLMEIGGGYLMWLWLREKWAWWIGLIGALVIVGYGIVPTLQPAHFGRVYAAYGGVFVIMSLFWGWLIDGVKPDISDLIGVAFCLIGVGFIMYTPRGY
jgi:small multidrug resistance family-3 protein